jgi:hypothetical protein
MRNVCRILVGKSLGKSLLRRSLMKRYDNIKMNLTEMVYVDREWMELTQDRVQWQVLVLAVLTFRDLLMHC